jgi:hypothetical protein
MDDPQIGADPNRIDCAKRVASVPERDFEYAAVNSLEWLRLVGLTSLGRDSQRATNLKLNLNREGLEILQGGL